jgi:hypothetical protein
MLRNDSEERSSQHYLWPQMPPFQDSLWLHCHPVGTIQGIVTILYQNFHLLRLDNRSQRGIGGRVTPKLSVVSRRLFKHFSVVTLSQVNQGKHVVQKNAEHAATPVSSDVYHVTRPGLAGNRRTLRAHLIQPIVLQ